MGGAEDFRADIADLVHDRIDAVGGVFDDLPLLHKYQSGTIVMAMPRHDATRLDRELAEAQLAIPDVGRLLFQIDRAERDVGNADRLVVDHLPRVRLDLVRRTFTGEHGVRREQERAGKSRPASCVGGMPATLTPDPSSSASPGWVSLIRWRVWCCTNTWKKCPWRRSSRVSLHR